MISSVETVTDTALYRPVTDIDVYRLVTDTVLYRLVTDIAVYRLLVADAPSSWNKTHRLLCMKILTKCDCRPSAPLNRK